MEEEFPKIKPTKARHGEWKIGTFDIETRPVNGENSLIAPFCMAAASIDGKQENVSYYDSMVSILDYMLRKGPRYRWFSHNGAGFDLKYIFSDSECIAYLAENGFSAQLIGGDIPKGVVFRRKGKRIVFADSAKLMPDKLRELAIAFGSPVSKGEIKFDEGELFEPDNSEHVAYLRDDVVSLWHVVSKYRETIKEQFGTEIKCTASSTAFAAWRSMLDKTVYHMPDDVNELARQCYYGGRTECYKQGIYENLNYIDVNSLYAYIMREFGAPTFPYITDHYEGNGFYKVKAIVPKGLKFGPLPVRKDDGTGIVFPTGTFETYVSSLEIDLAREIGCIVDVVYGYAFQKIDNTMYEKFIDKCSYLRNQDYKGPLGKTAKFLQNNLYGYFGMKTERDEIVFSSDFPGEDYCELLDVYSGEVFPNLWTRTQNKTLINCIPAFAAWITAAARCHILRAALVEEAAGNEVVYMDTDSLVINGEPVNKIEDGVYGAFKLEYKVDTMIAISGKTYALIVDGKPIYKCKGLPNKRLRMKMYLDAVQGIQNKIPYTQMNSLIQIMKGKELGSGDASRFMPSVYSMTTRVRGKDGNTLPVHIGE